MKQSNLSRGITILAIALAASTPGRAAPTPPVADAGQTALRLVADVQGTWTAPPRRTPSSGMPDGPLEGNGDVGVTLGGPPDALRFYVGKSDFFGVVRGGVMPVGSLSLSIPALQGASYQMQQNIGPATVTGKFIAGASALSLTSWIADDQNLVVIKLTNTGSAPLAITSQLLDLFSTSGNAATLGSSADSTWLQVSPDSVEVDLGKQLHGVDPRSPYPPHAFQGQIADVRIYDQTLSESALGDADTEPTPVARWQALPDTQTTEGITLDTSAPHGGAAQFTGAGQGAISLGVLRIPQRQFTVSAWVNVGAANGSQAIVSAMSDPYTPRNYPFQRGVWLGLADGKLSATLNQTTVTAPSPLPLNQWVRVAATYDGQTMTVWADGKQLASTHDFPTAADVMGWNQEAIHLGSVNQ